MVPFDPNVYTTEVPGTDIAGKCLSCFREYSACIVCGGRRLRELCGFHEMECEGASRERLFRELYPAGTPDFMLKDRAFPTQT